MFSRHLIVAIYCCLLAACATPRFDSSMANPDWEISGKIGIQQKGTRSVSVLFKWRQKKNDYAIFLFNNLGQIQLTIIGNNKTALAQQPDGTTTSASTPEALLKKLTGWSFPVSDTRYWIQGKTRGSETMITHSSQGLISAFKSRQWQVKLMDYKEVSSALLPHKLKLQQENIHITLVIKEHALFIP